MQPNDPSLDRLYKSTRTIGGYGGHCVLCDEWRDGGINPVKVRYWVECPTTGYLLYDSGVLRSGSEQVRDASQQADAIAKEYAIRAVI